jgi:site-specific DNA-methyltransferase (adenine-specific)
MEVSPSAALHQGDAVAWLRSLPAASIDLVVTDPPYESLEKHRAIGTTTRLKRSQASSNIWFDIFPNSRFEELFAQVYRVLKADRHFYLFCDQETMFVAKPLAEQAGFRFWKPLVWDKMKIGMGYHYRARYEFILFFEKGKRRLNDLGVADVIEVPRIFNGYPTEKPAQVSEVLVRQSTQPGELVIDPFLGAGGAGVAAVRLGRNFRGNDIRAEALDISRERLTQAGAQIERSTPAQPNVAPHSAAGGSVAVPSARTAPEVTASGAGNVSDAATQAMARLDSVSQMSAAPGGKSFSRPRQLEMRRSGPDAIAFSQAGAIT